MEFRAFLIKLFNQLSDSDRQALHFSLENIIQCKYREDCTSISSLHLLDVLFDQNFINEQINCYSASTQLKEYKLNNILRPIVEPVSSSLNESIFIVEHDKLRNIFNEIQQRQSSQFLPISTESSIELEYSTRQLNLLKIHK